MQKRINKKRYATLVSAFLFAGMMLINTSCETEDDEMCEEVPDVCIETVTICSSTTEEYYIFENDTIYCAGIDNCDDAVKIVTSSCTQAAVKNEIEIKQHLETIMASLRSRHF